MLPHWSSICQILNSQPCPAAACHWRHTLLLAAAAESSNSIVCFQSSARTGVPSESLATAYLLCQQLAAGLLVARWQRKDILKGVLHQRRGPPTHDNTGCGVEQRWRDIAEVLQVLDGCLPCGQSSCSWCHGCWPLPAGSSCLEEVAAFARRPVSRCTR